MPQNYATQKKLAINGLGFTLLELIAVVVVVGVLSAFAIPRFFNLAGSAQIATLDAIAGALKASSKAVNAESILQSISTGTIAFNGDTIPVIAGYMEGRGTSSVLKTLTLSGLTTGLTINTQCPSYYCSHGNEISMPAVTGASGGKGVYFWPKGHTISDNCFAYYYNRENGSAPLIGTLTSGC